MISLIKNELTKIFKKKAIYILSLVLFAFVILTNVIYKTAFDEDGNMQLFNAFSDYQKVMLEENLNNYDPSTDPDGNYYASLKGELAIYDIKDNYGEDSWQYYYTSMNKLDLFVNRELVVYKNLENTEYGQSVLEEYNLYIEKLKNNDWRYFVLLEKEDTEISLNSLEEQYQNTLSISEKESLETTIASMKISLELLNYRLDKNISYGTNYLNQALENYQNSSLELIYLEEYNEEDYQQKLSYNNAIKTKALSKYTLDTGKNISKVNSLKGILGNSFNEYELFVIILIVIVAGTIVSEEFNKGTIKLLLVKPYKRSKILLSKYLTSFIIVIFSILLLFILNFIVGGIFFGFDSLSIPAVLYDFNNNSVVTMNGIVYFFLLALTKLPLLILIMSCAFMLSTVFTNSVISITLTLVLYTFAGIINELIIGLNVKFLNFLVTLNWNFEQYLFGALPSFEHINLIFSSVMCLLYLLVFLALSFITFKRKNIKNI